MNSGKLLRLKQAAALLGIGYDRALDLVQEGHINAFRPGGRRGWYLIEAEEIERIKRETATSKGVA